MSGGCSNSINQLRATICELQDKSSKSLTSNINSQLYSINYQLILL